MANHRLNILHKGPQISSFNRCNMLVAILLGPDFLLTFKDVMIDLISVMSQGNSAKELTSGFRR